MVDLCSVNQIIQFGTFFFKNNIIFHSFEVGNCVSNSRVSNKFHKFFLQFSSTRVKVTKNHSKAELLFSLKFFIIM